MSAFCVKHARERPRGGPCPDCVKDDERDDRLRAEGAAAERKRIVAWLRRHPINATSASLVSHAAADAIEAGAADGGGA